MFLNQGPIAMSLIVLVVVLPDPAVPVALGPADAGRSASIRGRPRPSASTSSGCATGTSSLGGVFAGLGGAFLSMEAHGIVPAGMTAGRGFIGLAAMIVGRWTPLGAFGAALLFASSSDRHRRVDPDPPPTGAARRHRWRSSRRKFCDALPYIVTIIVLAGVVGRSIPPAADGQPYGAKARPDGEGPDHLEPVGRSRHQASQTSRSPRTSSMEPATAVVRYVALGDSYTIGTSVTVGERFPDQLVAAVRPRLELVANLGVDGYTTADLIRDELPALAALEPGFVTLLIGVNDVVQGVPAAAYERNVETILDRLLVLVPADRIVTISIPDYTVTPAGADYGDPTAKRAGIVANNATMARRSAERSIRFVDIFDISSGALEDRTLVASDGLHPSGAQYARWVERIRPVVEALLGR